jgi:hypothetical protein
MQVIAGEHMYVIDDALLRRSGMEAYVLLFDAGKITGEKFIEAFKQSNPHLDIDNENPDG